MSTGVMSRGRAKIAEKTLRTDRWWLPPALTVAGLVAWLTYATVRVFWQDAYFAGQNEEQPFLHYLTPFYSPCISEGCVDEASMFGQFLPDAWWLPYAAMTLPFLLMFRLTCYYYRKAYYRSFWLSPPACAVAEPHAKYTGETRFPLIGQNAHRYFFYAAVIISAINTWDTIVPFMHGEDGGFGVGLGNIVLLGNVIMLWLYTVSCHSCRSVIGGRLTHFSKHPVRYKLWGWVSRLNTRHMELAWITLLTLALTDFYVMLVASGTITDLRFFN